MASAKKGSRKHTRAVSLDMMGTCLPQRRVYLQVFLEMNRFSISPTRVIGSRVMILSNVDAASDSRIFDLEDVKPRKEFFATTRILSMPCWSGPKESNVKRIVNGERQVAREFFRKQAPGPPHEFGRRQFGEV